MSLTSISETLRRRATQQLTLAPDGGAPAARRFSPQDDVSSRRAVSSIVLNWCGHVSGAGGAKFAAIQPARHGVDYRVGILELWCMSDVMENLGVPLGISGGRYARGGDGHQPIPIAVDE